MKTLALCAVAVAVAGCSLIPREYQDDITYSVVCSVNHDRAYIINPLGMSGRVRRAEVGPLCVKLPSNVVAVPAVVPASGAVR